VHAVAGVWPRSASATRPSRERQRRHTGAQGATGPEACPARPEPAAAKRRQLTLARESFERLALEDGRIVLHVVDHASRRNEVPRVDPPIVCRRLLPKARDRLVLDRDALDAVRHHGGRDRGNGAAGPMALDGATDVDDADAVGVSEAEMTVIGKVACGAPCGPAEGQALSRPFRSAPRDRARPPAPTLGLRASVAVVDASEGCGWKVRGVGGGKCCSNRLPWEAVQ